MQLIKDNLNLLGIKHNNFVYESKLIKNNEVSKIVKKLRRENYIYEGKLDIPKGEQTKDWKIRKVFTRLCNQKCMSRMNRIIPPEFLELSSEKRGQ